jgi:hypothetical protein
MPNSSNVKETIDERILRLLGLEDVFDLDYGTYLTLLKEAMVKGRMTNKSIPTEEVELLTNEYKRVKSKKDQGRFSVKKKKISTQSFGAVNFSAVQKKIKIENLLPAKSQQLYLPSAGKGNQQEVKSGSHIAEISKSLANIIKILNSSIVFDKKVEEKRRRERETSAREKEESNLERGFKLVKKTLSKVLAPVKNILSSIIDFFMKMFFARVVYRLLEWMADPKNQDKLKSIFRFLGDHWPKLLALYIRFGTGFGKFVGGITKLVFFGTRKLLQVVAQLVGAKGAARFLGGKGGRLAAAGLSVAATVGTTMALSSGVENFAGIGGENPEKEKTPAFSGGGLAKFKNLLGFFSGGYNSGYVSGQKGVDKIPAMLSDGEFVMSRGAVQKYGVNTLESMNAAGGGTNKPKMISGIPHAAGGGLIGGETPKPPELKKEAESGLVKPKPMSTTAPQSNFRTSSFDERLKRIENQIQIQKRLKSGEGVNVRGATLGMNIGKGYGTTYKKRQSIIIPGAALTGWEPEINLGGVRYFGQVRGNDVIYSSNYAKGLAGQVDKYGARNKSYQTGGGALIGGSGLKKTDKKDLPKSRIMTGPDGKIFVGYLTFKNGQPFYERAEQRQKGLLENITNFFDPRGAKAREETLNARNVRMTSINDLEDFRKRGMDEKNIKKMMGSRYSQAVNDLKAKEARIKKDKLMKQQSGMANYSADSIRKAQQAAGVQPKIAPTAPKPPVKPPNPKPVVVRSNVAGGGMNGARGGRSLPSNTPNSPKIPASHPAGTRRQEATLGIRR